MRLLNFFNAMAIFLMTVIKDSLCANFECQHGAKCKIVKKRPKCECYPAWGGRHCEQLLVQPVATSTEMEDTTSSSVLPRIWTETITENSVEVIFLAVLPFINGALKTQNWNFVLKVRFLHKPEQNLH